MCESCVICKSKTGLDERKTVINGQRNFYLICDKCVTRKFDWGYYEGDYIRILKKDLYYNKKLNVNPIHRSNLKDVKKCDYCKYLFWGQGSISKISELVNETMCCNCHRGRGLNPKKHNVMVHQYGTKINWGNVAGSSLKMGFELEMAYPDDQFYDGRLSIFDHLKNCSLTEKSMLVHDSSINSGEEHQDVEYISKPMTLDEHKAEQYKKFLSLLQETGAASHDVKTCGLHVHVNKNFFRAKGVNIENNIKLFFVKNAEKIIKLSRRVENSHFNRYCKIPESVDTWSNYDRYLAVNFCNSNTFEFRFFRGTLNYESFISSLEFVDALCRFLKKKKTSKILLGEDSFKHFLMFVVKSQKYENLTCYLKARNLFDETIKIDNIKEKVLDKGFVENDFSGTVSENQINTPTVLNAGFVEIDLSEMVSEDRIFSEITSNHLF